LIYQKYGVHNRHNREPYTQFNTKDPERTGMCGVNIQDDGQLTVVEIVTPEQETD